MFSFLLVYYTQEWNYWVGSWVVVVVKSLSDNAGDIRDMGSILGLGRSWRRVWQPTPGKYSCLENSMDRRAWQTTVHGVAKSWTWLSDFQGNFTGLPL